MYEDESMDLPPGAVPSHAGTDPVADQEWLSDYPYTDRHYRLYESYDRRFSVGHPQNQILYGVVLVDGTDVESSTSGSFDPSPSLIGHHEVLGGSKLDRAKLLSYFERGRGSYIAMPFGAEERFKISVSRITGNRIAWDNVYRLESWKRCPYCNEVLRSALAQQCFHCGADWHRRLSPEKLREMFIRFAGPKRFRRFVHQLRIDAPQESRFRVERKRLRFWQEALWRKFSCTVDGASCDLQEIRWALLWCDVHHRYLETETTILDLPKASDQDSNIEDRGFEYGRDEQFPFGLGGWLSCPDCVSAYLRWIQLVETRFDGHYLRDVVTSNARSVKHLEKGIIYLSEYVIKIFEATFYADEKTWRECLATIPLSLRPKFLEYARFLPECDFMPGPHRPFPFDEELIKRLRRPRWMAYYRIIEEMCGSPTTALPDASPADEMPPEQDTPQPPA